MTDTVSPPPIDPPKTATAATPEPSPGWTGWYRQPGLTRWRRGPSAETEAAAWDALRQHALRQHVAGTAHVDLLVMPSGRTP